MAPVIPSCAEYVAVAASNDGHTATTDSPALGEEKFLPNEPLRNTIQGGIALADQIVISAANFFTLAIISRNCTLQQTGFFALAWTITNFVRTVQERTIATPYMVFVFQKDSASFLGSTLVQQLCLSLAASAIVLLVAVGGMLRGDFELSSVLAATAITLPILLLRECIRSVSFAHFQFSSAFGLDLAASVTQVLAIMALAYLQLLSIMNATLVMGLACLVPSLSWLLNPSATLRIDRGRLREDWKYNWQFSRFLLVARLLGMGGFLLMPWLVQLYLSSAEVGAFAVCNSLVGISLLFVTGTNNYFQPRIVRELHQHGPSAMLRSILVSSLVVGFVLVVISTLLWFFGDHLLGWVYGQPYSGYGALVIILCLSVTLVSPSIQFGNGLAALKRTELQVWSEAAYFVLTISLGLLLIPQIKLIGAGIALLVGGAVASLVSGAILVALVRHDASTQVALSEPVAR